MHASRFDLWTRRRFGLTTGGALAAALSLSACDRAHGRKKRKKRKRRCRKNHQTCTPPGAPGRNKKRCCKGLTCNDETNDPNVGACCRYFQATCQSESQCCTSFKCQKAIGLPGDRCCAPLHISCKEDSDCCAGDGVICHPTLQDCCRDVQASCAATDECCGELQCADVPALGGLHCCAGDNDACQENDDCCFGLACINNVCAE